MPEAGTFIQKGGSLAHIFISVRAGHQCLLALVRAMLHTGMVTRQDYGREAREVQDQTVSF